MALFDSSKHRVQTLDLSLTPGLGLNLGLNLGLYLRFRTIHEFND